MKIQTLLISLTGIAAFLILATAGHGNVSAPAVPALSLSFFNTEKPSQFIVVEKSSQKLMVFEQRQRLELLRTFICATGENPGSKMRSGDAKTPEGIYYITEIYKDSKITVFGSRAYHLDYPNAFDRNAGHNGDGIFIHGTNKELIPYSTNGCVTLANNDLDELAPFLQVETVPIIIVETLPTPFIGTDLRLAINNPRFGEILKEISFYPGDMPTEDIANLSFLALGSKAVASINYRINDGNSLEYRYRKRVYLTAGVSQKWRNLYSVEHQREVPTLLASQPVKNELIEKVYRPETVSVQMDLGTELLDFIHKWQTAWSSKDIDSYIECYSPSFRYGNLDLQGWKNRKDRLNRKYEFIKVAIHNIVIEWTAAGANVSFFQEYQSDQYQSRGKKLLQLVNRDSQWMIQKEIM